MDDFRAGDVVRLSADENTPRMSIRWVEKDTAYCEWFDGTDVKGRPFQLVQLVKIEMSIMRSARVGGFRSLLRRWNNG